MTRPRESNGRHVRSATTIAKYLHAEGFTDYVANGVESYWRYQAGLNIRRLRQLEELEKELSRVMQVLPIGDRLIIGRFIGIHKKMSFDTGLTIGLQAFAQRCDTVLREEKKETGKPMGSAEEPPPKAPESYSQAGEA